MTNLFTVLVVTSVLQGGSAFEHEANSLCSHPHYDLEMRVMVTYFSDSFYITIIETDIEHEHRVSTLKCMKIGKHTRPFLLFNSVDKLKFNKPRNSTMTSYSQIHGYFVKGDKAEALKFFAKISKRNPMSKVMIQLTYDDDIETSNSVLQTAYEKYKMLNVATLHRQVRRASLKFYNPFLKQGDFHIINITQESDLVEIEKYQHERIFNLHKFPIRMYIFETPMTVKKVTLGKTSKIAFAYADGELGNMLAEKLNFTTVYVLLQEETSHKGFLLPNGSFSGGIGAIENNRADLLMNPRLISDQITTRATYLHPLTTASYKYVIQRRKHPRVLPLSIFSLYDVPSRIIALTLLLLFPIIYMAVNRTECNLLAEHSGHRKHQRSLLNYCTYMFALHNNISMRQTHIAPPCSRIIIFVVIFYVLIASSIFQGNIVKILDRQTEIRTINDMEDLFEENYKFVLSHVLADVLQQQTGDRMSEKLRKVAANATTVGIERAFQLLLKENNHACLLDTLFASANYISRYYDNKTGENLFEVVPEEAFQFYTAIMAARDSPLIRPLNEFIIKWIEGGFGSYHIQRATDDISIQVLNEKHRKGLTSNNKYKSLSLEDVKPVLVLYTVMIVVCIIAFLFEISFFRISIFRAARNK